MAHKSEWRGKRHPHIMSKPENPNAHAFREKKRYPMRKRKKERRNRETGDRDRERQSV